MARAADREARKREYWRRRMEEAFAFMRAVEAYPVEECGEPLADLVGAVAAAGAEVVFSGTPCVDGLPRLFLLREGLVGRFVAACREMNARGWVMKVEDAYRTRAMQKALALKPSVFQCVWRTTAWEAGGEPPQDLLARRLAATVAASPKVGTHMSGSAMDISVLDRATGVEVDRGGPYLTMSAVTPMDSPFMSPAAKRNRREITGLMRRHGFATYPYEFWHYNAGDAYAGHLAGVGEPARYGPVEYDSATGRVTPISDPTQPLNSAEDIRQAFVGKGN